MDEMWLSMYDEATRYYDEMVMEKGVLNVPDEELTEEDLRLKHFMLDNEIDDEYTACKMIEFGITKEQAEEAIREEEEMAWEDGMLRWAEA